MSFLYPAFLFGAALIAIPLVLHLLRRDVAPEVPFSAVRLLRRSPVERSHRRRPRDLLLLAARVGALLLLAAAFARPYSGASAAAPSRVRIVVVDRSFSMSAPGTFERALATAREAIAETGTGERVGVIAFDDRADAVAAPGGAAEARAALGQLTPGFGATRYGPAIAKAVEMADGAPGSVIVVTDLQRTGWEDEPPQALPAALQMTVRDVGPPAENLAVIHVAARADRVVSAIRNAGTRARDGRVRTTIDGRETGWASFTVPPGSTIDVAVPQHLPASGTLAVSIDDPSGYAADNVRYAALDGASRSSVIVVTSPGAGGSGLYVAHALDAASAGDDSFEVRSLASPDLSGGEPLARAAAIVLLSTRGLDRAARESLAQMVRGGGGLLVAAGPDVDASVLSAMFGWRVAATETDQRETAVTLAATDLRHPIFRPFGALAANLGQVRFSRGWRVRGEGWDVAARFTDGSPALLERREGQGHIVLFASDLDRRWNDFPLHPAFVPFALESVRYVARGTSESREYLVGGGPADLPALPGVYRIGPSKRLAAVNVDPRESAATRIAPEEFERMVPRVPLAAASPADIRARQAEAHQNLWRYGLMLMLATLVAESFVGRA